MHHKLGHQLGIYIHLINYRKIFHLNKKTHFEIDSRIDPSFKFTVWVHITEVLMIQLW